MEASSEPPKSYASVGATWGERLFLNLLSYSFVIFPIAFIVLITKYRLCPKSFQSNALVQFFVYGGTHLSKSNSNKGDDNASLLPNDGEDRKSSRSNYKNTESTDSGTMTFVYCFLGLQLSYLVWGVLQEKIMTTRYPITLTKDLALGLFSGELNRTMSDVDGKWYISFHDSQFLVFINRIVAFILSILALLQDRPKKSRLISSKTHTSYLQQEIQTKPQAPLYEFIYCSLSNILSSWCQYEALKYVNFPTQVLSKSCKLVPVMLMSRLMLRKKYQRFDYFCAFMLSVGMFIFLLNQPSTKLGSGHIKPLQDRSGTNSSIENVAGNKGPSVQIESTNIGSGESLHQKLLIINDKISKHVTGSSLTSGLIILGLYLTFDSFTSNWQQSLFTRYTVSKWQMMAATNFYSIMLTLTSLHQLGGLRPAFKMLYSSTNLLADCILMSVMSSVGQLFVYFTIKRFGSVVFTVIMTFRQFLAILLSCAIYGHRLTLGSTAGLIMIFLIVGFQLMHKSRGKSGGGSNRSKDSGTELSKLDRMRTKFSTVIVNK